MTIAQPTTAPLLRTFAFITLTLVGAYTVLVIWDISVTGLVASAGIVGLALSFAAQDTLGNLFAGISILSAKEDIANVRLQFRNGCVANFTASRVSTEKVRKLRLFQPREYISVDYTRQDALSIRVDERQQVSFHPLVVQKDEPLVLQFNAFLDSIESRRTPKVHGRAARRTLEVALAILDKMKAHAEVVAQSLVTEWKP